MFDGSTQIMSRPSDADSSRMQTMLHREGVTTRSSSAAHYQRGMTTKTPEPAPSSFGETKQKLVKEPPKPRRKWKKAKDAPKRPLSAYNLYFREERDRVINEQAPDSANAISFRDMAQLIASKWNSLNEKEKSKYMEQAMEEKGRYFVALSQWKKKKKNEAIKVADQKQEIKETPKTLPKKSVVKTKKSKASLPPKKRAPEVAASRNQTLVHQSAPLPHATSWQFPARKPALVSPSTPLPRATMNGHSVHHDNHEPLPIEHPMDISHDLTDVFSSCDDSSFLGEDDPHHNSKKSGANLIDALQSSLGCYPSDDSVSLPSPTFARETIPPRHQHHAAASLPLQQPGSHFNPRHYQENKYYQACDAVTKRVVTCLDALRADKDFVAFMGALEWK